MRGHSGEDKNTSADDSADAQAGQRHGSQDSPQTIFTFQLLQKQLKRLSSEKVICHIDCSLVGSDHSHWVCYSFKKSTQCCHHWLLTSSKWKTMRLAQFGDSV